MAKERLGKLDTAVAVADIHQHQAATMQEDLPCSQRAELPNSHRSSSACCSERWRFWRQIPLLWYGTLGTGIGMSQFTGQIIGRVRRENGKEEMTTKS